jgi:hypothetical protein
VSAIFVFVNGMENGVTGIGMEAWQEVGMENGITEIWHGRMAGNWQKRLEFAEYIRRARKI